MAENYDDWLKTKGLTNSAKSRADYAQYRAGSAVPGTPEAKPRPELLKSLPVSSPYSLSGGLIGGKPAAAPQDEIETYDEWIARTGKRMSPGTALEYAGARKNLTAPATVAPAPTVPEVTPMAPPQVAKPSAPAPVEIAPAAIPDMAGEPPVPQYTGDGDPNDPGTKIEPGFWDKVLSLGKDTGKGIAGLISSALGGYNAAAQGRAFDYMKDTAPGREKARGQQKEDEVSDFQRKIAYLDAQQGFQSAQAELDRQHADALARAATEAEKEAATLLYQKQSAENKASRDNALQIALIGAGRGGGLVPTGDPVGLGSIPAKR
jgi:hypothetical protein